MENFDLNLGNEFHSPHAAKPFSSSCSLSVEKIRPVIRSDLEEIMSLFFYKRFLLEPYFHVKGQNKVTKFTSINFENDQRSIGE